MKLYNILLVLVLVISAFSIAGCGEEPECESSSDCTTGNPCIMGRCNEDGKCVKTIKPDCCGNAKCDEDVGENKCVCPKDCGECEGMVKYNVSSLRGLKEVDSKYARYLCVNDQCKIGVDEEDISTFRLTGTIDVRNRFEIETLTTINSPFDVTKEKVGVRLTLKDTDSSLVGGVTFTGIQVLSKNELMSEKSINQKLSNIGDSFTEELVLISSQTKVEQIKDIDIKYEYTYDYIQREEQYTERADSTKGVSKDIYFVVPE